MAHGSSIGGFLLVDVCGTLPMPAAASGECGRTARPFRPPCICVVPAAASLPPEAISVTVLRRPAAIYPAKAHKTSTARSAHGHRLTRAHAKARANSSRPPSAVAIPAPPIDLPIRLSTALRRVALFPVQLPFASLSKLGFFAPASPI